MIFDDGTKLTMTGDKVRMENGDTFVELTDASLVAKKGLLVQITPSRVDLGGLGGSQVSTVAGPSSKVFAIL